MIQMWKRFLCSNLNFVTSVATNPFNEEKLIHQPIASNQTDILPHHKEDDFTDLSLMNQATRIICNARNIVVITGAGISADSGIPTYRSLASTQEGIWNKAGYFGMAFYGSWIGWMLRNNRAWKLYYEHYYQYSVKAEPNAGHMALYDLYKLKQKHGEFTVITQNVDGLHHKSGIDEDDIIEMHGNASRFKCNLCGSKQMNNLIIPRDINDNFQSPTCRKCKIGKARPDVVFFGERLGIFNVLNVLGIFRELNENDCVIVIGTSLVVKPVAELPQIAIDNGIPIIEINLYGHIEKQYIGARNNNNNIFLEGSASVVLPKIINLLCALVLKGDNK